MKPKNNKKSGLSDPIIFALMFMGLFSIWVLFDYRDYQKNTINLKSKTISIKTQPIKNVNNQQKVDQLTSGQTISDSVNLNVPFITQAPFREWKVYPFNHTCEEASVLMLHYYLSGKKIVDENITKKELLTLVDFENKNYGFSDDTNTEQTARLIRDYYGYKVEVFYDISLEDIKKELVKGNPVIVPAAGRLLLNPHFTPPGPIYHMLVIKGYDSENFIVNDPGTYRTGIDYKYSYKILENAIHDFDLENPANGRKAMIVVTN